MEAALKEWRWGVGSRRRSDPFLCCLQFLEAAEAKASFGLAVNYKALEALVDALVEKEVLTGEQVTEILEANQVVYFPDPFLEGFGYDEDGKLDYPNRVQEVRS